MAEMRDPTQPLPPVVPVPVRRIDLRPGTFRRPLSFDLSPTRAEAAAIAAGLGLSALPSLRFRGVLRPHGRADAELDARLEAAVVQPCVVTLAPVPATIAEDVARRYLADWTPPDADETEIPADDTAEELPPWLDLWEVAIEALALALPLYPRAPGAEFGAATAAPPGAAALDEGALRPFAALAALRPPAAGGD